MFGPDSSTVELVRRAQTGDHGAFATLYDRHARAVATVVASRLRTPDDRADAVQDTFAKAWTKLGELREPDRFVPWLYAIARNAATSMGRAHARRGEAELPDEATVAADDDAPEDLATAAALARAVQAAGAVLSHRDATVLSMAVNFGFGPSEIATALGITENNAAVVLHRARKRLRAALAVRNGEPEV